MKTNSFLLLIKEYLEIEDIEIKLETTFSSLSAFDSMGRMSIISLCDEHFNKAIGAEDLNKLVYIKDLIELIGLEKFEDYHV